MVLTINTARYGDFKAKKTSDVTGKLRQAVTNPEEGGALDLVVNNGTMGGDPAPKKAKELKVTYTTAPREAPKEVTLKEGETLKLQGAPPVLPGTLDIKEAKWGVLNDPKKSVDVTNIAKLDASLTSNNSLQLVAKTDTFRRDPAPGAAKQLLVKYTDTPEGEVKEATANEGETLIIKSAPAQEGGQPVEGQDKAASTVEVKPAPEPGATDEQPPASAPAPEAPTADDAVVPQPPPPQAAVSGKGGHHEWKSENGQLLVDGQRFHLKGVDWPGLETEGRQLHNLDKITAREYVDHLASNGINAVRLPISTTLGLDLDSPTRKATNDPDLKGLSAGQTLERVVDLLGEKGIQVVVDMHRIDELSEAPERWFDGRHSTEDLLRAWDNVLCRLKGRPNLMAIDIKGAPHGESSWGDSNPSYDWNKAAEQIAHHIIDSHPDYKGLFFIQGVSDSSKIDSDHRSCFPSWYGGNLQGVEKHPIRLKDGCKNDSRVVYAPHAFGPSTHAQEYFCRGDFPGVMWQVWDEHWGFAKDATGRAVVLGEFGGKNDTDQDRVWHNCIVDYMTQKDIQGFYKGDLDDDKLKLLARMTPNPTRL